MNGTLAHRLAAPAPTPTGLDEALADYLLVREADPEIMPGAFAERLAPDLRTSFLLATMVLTACDGGEKDPVVDDTDDTDVPCVSGIASTFPAQNDTAAFYRTSIEVVFNQDEKDSSTLTLKDGCGADVAGTVTYSTDGKTAYFDAARWGYPADQYPTEQKDLNSNGCLKLENGDVLLAFTDGLVEAHSVTDREQLFGEERVKQILVEHAKKGSDAETITRALAEAAFQFAGGKHEDDITLVVIRKNG